MRKKGLSEKKAFFYLMAYIVGVGLTIAALVFCVDPFYQYHKVWFDIPVILNNAVYQTPGAARNLSYDSVIVGTSMTENFHSSWFDEMGWNTIKLSYSGARSNDLKAIFEQIYSRETAPENVVMDINDYQLTEPAWTAYTERPQYLYDNCILNDAEYLYNQDIVEMVIERIRDKYQGLESNLDSAYVWEDDILFGRQIAMNAVKDSRLAAQETGKLDTDLEEMLQRCDENLNNIIPFIEAHPETEFYIFYPPYSMLSWELKKLRGTLDEMLKVYEHSIERFLQYENVQVYYFQMETDIITNLDNYRDEAHHKPKYNRYIFECIRDGKNRITMDNLRTQIMEMYHFADQYDYDSMWADYSAE